MAFTHMVLASEPIQHDARGSTYEIRVYRVIESGEHRVFVAKDGFSVGSVVAAASEDVIRDAKTTAGADIVQTLLDAVMDDIDRNEFGDW